MSVTKAKKAEMLKELKAHFEKAKVAVFSQYSGLNVQDTVKMRKGLHKQGFDYKVAKKTLIKLAMKELGYGAPTDEMLKGPVSVLFGYDDEIAPVKKIHSYAKEFEGLKLLGAYMNGELVGEAAIKELAMLPSMEELLAKFVGLLAAPLNTFGGMLNSPLSSFARAVKAYSECSKVAAFTGDFSDTKSEATANEDSETATSVTSEESSEKENSES